MSEDILDRRIGIFELPARCFNALRQAGILTLGDLVTCKPCDLTDLRRFGETSLVAVKEYLAQFGLKLEEDTCHDRSQAPYPR